MYRKIEGDSASRVQGRFIEQEIFHHHIDKRESNVADQQYTCIKDFVKDSAEKLNICNTRHTKAAKLE